MITEDQYVEACLQRGVKGHLHDGVWWRFPAPLYAKPMFEFHTIVPGGAKPSFAKAPLGFSHHVVEARQANRTMEYMILEGDDLALFGLERLPGKKRNQVRKGLKSCEVRLVQDVDRHLEDIRSIYIAQATRHTASHDLPDTPPSFYVQHADLWRARERQHLTAPGREVWGAFVDDRLVAFLVSSQIDTVRFIEKMKSHTDFLKACPSDALYFTVIDHATRNDGCRTIVNPGLRGGSMDRYKEQFLFKRTGVPVYVSNAWLFRTAQVAYDLAHRARGIVRARRQGKDLPPAAAEQG